VRQGLTRGDRLVVVLEDEGRAVLRRALGNDAARIEFADAGAWYQSPEHAFQRYSRYVEDHLERGAPRVRVVAEVIWPAGSATADVAGWKRYEAGISVAMASVPVSFICAYNSLRLPKGIITDAQRTHPLSRRTAERPLFATRGVHPRSRARRAWAGATLNRAKPTHEDA
jgi:hypothetical protein